MDPDACWAGIVAALSSRVTDPVDRDLLVADLRNLADWISRGGYLPKVPE